MPIEITVPEPAPAKEMPSKATVEIATAGVEIRCEVGTDVGYVAALVRAFERR